MKEETLEEAASRLLYNKYPYHPPQDSGYWQDMFKEGAKWQQERMYSEEEVRYMLQSYAEWSIDGDCTYYEWFEQFKKE